MATVGTVDFSKTIKKLEKITAEAKKEMAAALFVSGLKIEDVAKIEIAQGIKTGRVYKRGGKPHIASAAGEAPASDTGRLVNSINTGAKSDGMVVEVTAGKGVVDYAVHLEYGTEKMAARPFMKPSLEKSRKFIHDRMEKAVQKVIDKNAIQ